VQQLLGGPRSTLTEALVRTTLMHEIGTKVRHGVEVLSTSGAVLDAAVKVLSGEVLWAYRPPSTFDEHTNEAAEVRRTATLTIGPTSLNVETLRFRIWTEMQAPDQTWIRFNLGVFVSTNPPVEDDGLVVTRTLRLADKTYRYRMRELDDTIVIAPATNPVAYVVASLASVFGETAFAIPATAVTLDEAMVFEAGTSYLAMYNALLQVCAYDQLTVDEDLGRPRSVPLAELAGRGAEWTYGPGTGKIKTAGRVEPLIEHLPNVIRFVARQGPSLAEEGNGFRTVTNQSTGPASVDQRGETIVQRIVVDAEDQTQLDAIAAADAQRWFAGGGLRYVGQAGLNPLHSDRDVIALDKPRLGLAGEWLITEWRFPLNVVAGEQDVLMDITCEKRVA
jgi:hypothetical protein